MRYLNYERLKEITKIASPYRGSTNRYPIGKRTQNNKYFLEEKEGDEIIYRIIYGNSWTTTEITKEEYIVAKNNNDPDVYEQEDWNSKNKIYRRYKRKPNELGIVRPDNTFEFTKSLANGYGQGDKQILSGWSAGYLYSSSRQGGMVYRCGDVFHPVWEGMRVNCDTFEPTKPYKIMSRRVSRKDASSLLKDYKDFYKCADVMLQAMDTKTILGLGADLLAELAIDDKYMGSWAVGQELFLTMMSEANKRMSSSPLDGAILYCLAFNLDNMWRRVQNFIDPTKHNYYGVGTEMDTSTLFTRIRSRINKDLYDKNKSVMKMVEFPAGKVYPPTEWGVEVLVDGVVADQYS